MNEYTVIDILGSHHRIKADEYHVNDNKELLFFKQEGTGLSSFSKTICVFAEGKWIKASIDN